ncbi:Eco57I restriction-modification methylase domain-containing protein [Lutibacter sp.]|uniref:Eco57I restriction-modification methylase domain-containing protein n=1 Tax=Lutibacter sp. TaxID=1925666 RepID=UPI002733ED41|nr:TaqI-like C-terminal specificity domain-containing protein [Lutibacter sp.]MDP3313716.1 TaqI-like C-terminal specificity domain-containing protein [Lutibacter sp.]
MLPCQILNTEMHAPLPNTKNQTPLWTQKFGCKEISTEEYLFTAIDYIKHNRSKHNLPQHSKEIKLLVESIVCDYKHAFRKEYNGGFDVVIGNPPYVQYNNNFYSHFKTNKCGDLYALFFERGIKINNTNGMFGFITPSLFIKGMRYESLRELLLNNTEIIEIYDLGDKVFQDVQMPTAISILKNCTIKKQNWDKFITGNDLISKLDNNSIKLSEISKIMRGLEIGKDKVNIGNNDIEFLTGEDIFRYGIKSISSIPNSIYEEFKKDNYFFTENRILIRETGNRLTSTYIEKENFQQNRSLYSIKLNDENIFNYLYIISILNSNVIQFYYQTKFAANTDVFPKIRIGQVKELPIKKISFEKQISFTNKANQLIILLKDIELLSQKFQRALEREFFDKGLKPLANSPANPLPKKLQDWYLLSFAEFIKELEKKKVKLSLSQKAEWEDYFLQESKKALELKTNIDKTDKEIDAMVYELYGLTEEEIKIVENS